MAQDASDRSVGDLPDGVGEWVATLAEEEGVSKEEILGRLLTAGGGESATVPEGLDDDLDELQSTVTRLEEEVADFDEELDTKITDVRERVIQVKRDADEKAESDHDHPDLEVRLDNLDDDLDHLAVEMDELEADLDSRAETLQSEVESLQGDLEAHVDSISQKLEVLAVTVIGLRDRVQSLVAARERQRHLDDLRSDANRHGVRAASCSSCGERVEIALLTDSRCPHCNESFEDLDPKDGFFGSNVLVAGQPPALEGEVDVEDSELQDIVED